MIQNFTPLDLKKLTGKENHLNLKKDPNNQIDLLLLLATIMAAILAVLLFFLIQKRMASDYQININPLLLFKNLIKNQ